MASKTVRWIGIGLGAIAGLVCVAAGGVYAASESRLHETYDVTATALTIPTDPANIEHGRHLAVAIGKCSACHGNDLSGLSWLDDAAIGHFPGPNLTSGKGGIGATFKNADWVRAIRHGIAPDGRPLAFMPSEEFGNLADSDLADLIAYLKSLPPVDKEMPQIAVGPVGRMLMVTGELPLLAAERIDHQQAHPASLAPAPTADYGHYIAETGGCVGCHGAGLSGGHVPGTPPDDPNFPPAANITPGGPIAKWGEKDFFTAMRTGVRPDGSSLHPFMPWPLAGQMTDTEMKAVWAYLKSVPAKETGHR